MIEITKTSAPDIYFVKQIEVDSNLSSWSLEDYLLELERIESLFFVAKVKERIVGFVLARLIMVEQKDSINNEIEIYNIAVVHKYRRKLIASELLNRIIQNGLENSVQKIFLEVRKSNTNAQNFYKKQAFEVVGERKNFYTNPPEDALLMCRLIKSI